MTKVMTMASGGTEERPADDDQGSRGIHVGVLALQGAFSEHMQLLRQSFGVLDGGEAEPARTRWSCAEVRTPAQLDACDALIVPGGESTAIALVAARSGLLEPLRSFVKVLRKPVWGTCAGMILLAEAANRTKRGGQDLIGGLDVRVNRNYFGRQVESFEVDLDLPFLAEAGKGGAAVPFRAFFIRAPIVERILPPKAGIQDGEEAKPETVIAPSRTPLQSLNPAFVGADVEILGVLPRSMNRSRAKALVEDREGSEAAAEASSDDIVAVRHGNVLATSFHPELTEDARLHIWWLRQVQATLVR